MVAIVIVPLNYLNNMNIIGYVKQYGKYKFTELPFNDIDALIFAELAYLNIHLAVKGKAFRQIKNIKITDKKEFYKASVDAKNNQRLFEAMMKSNRYKNVKIGYPNWKDNLRIHEQFYAITLILPDETRYISFRGTDITVDGWKEDLLIAYKDDIPSQRTALKYINEVLKTFDGPFYIGGHSKGGNLAAYSALHMGEKYEERLIKVYSFDGPGFKTNVYEFDSYKRVSHKYVKYLTTHDIVGVIYNRNPNPIIVYSDGILLGGHDLFYWGIKKKEPAFVLTKERSAFSKDSESALMGWLNSEDDECKEIAVKVVFDLLGTHATLYDLLLNAGRLVTNGKKTIEGYTEEQRAKVKEIFKRLGAYYLRAYSPKKFLIDKFNKIKEDVSGERILEGLDVF